MGLLNCLAIFFIGNKITITGSIFYQFETKNHSFSKLFVLNIVSMYIVLVFDV